MWRFWNITVEITLFVLVYVIPSESREGSIGRNLLAAVIFDCSCRVGSFGGLNLQWRRGSSSGALRIASGGRVRASGCTASAAFVVKEASAAEQGGRLAVTER